MRRIDLFKVPVYFTRGPCWIAERLRKPLYPLFLSSVWVAGTPSDHFCNFPKPIIDIQCLNLCLKLSFHSSHYYLVHFSHLQLNATLWMPSRRDWKRALLYPYFILTLFDCAIQCGRLETAINSIASWCGWTTHRMHNSALTQKLLTDHFNRL